jgi:hypothetical protein
MKLKFQSSLLLLLTFTSWLVPTPTLAFPEKMTCDTAKWVKGPFNFGRMSLTEILSAADEASNNEKNNNECFITTSSSLITCGEMLGITLSSDGEALGMKLATSGGGDLSTSSSGVSQHENGDCFGTDGSSRTVSLCHQVAPIYCISSVLTSLLVLHLNDLILIHSFIHSFIDLLIHSYIRLD